MKMPKERIRQWINDLRSGKYKQTRHALQDAHGFCCLGVLCKIQVPLYAVDFYTGHLLESFPEQRNGAFDWIVAIDDDFENHTGVLLSQFNDASRLTFLEISDLLESVYILNEGRK